MSTPLIIAGIIGIVLGIVLVLFTFINRSKLPGGAATAFTIVGVLIAASGIFVTLGAGIAG
ncbi:MAG: hypothetical protein ACOYJI_07640 [Anaerovoracaceae bacterium]|jgi:hypothetical protein